MYLWSTFLAEVKEFSNISELFLNYCVIIIPNYHSMYSAPNNWFIRQKVKFYKISPAKQLIHAFNPQISLTTNSQQFDLKISLP